MRRLDWLRAIDPLIVDGVLAVIFFGIGLLTVNTQTLDEGMVEPGWFAVVTTALVCAPVAIRRRYPLVAVIAGCAVITAHIIADYPEGSLPITVLFLTYTVAAWSPYRESLIGLGAVYATLIAITFTDAPGLDALGTLSNIAFFTVAWAIGIALRARRESSAAQLHAAEERANVEVQQAARMLAEERLLIAQELHDVVAHSMSVIAVQAGAGAHVLEDRPDQARAALEAISATSRGTLTELRRLLGVLRDGDGNRASAPAPGMSDLPRLVDDVRAAGVPVSFTVTGSSVCVNAGVELSAYRVVQEALTNVMKHAGSPTRVDVGVEYRPGSLAIEVVDDGRGAAGGNGESRGQSGHGLVGMRERVELWGGELVVGPVAGGGYRVSALLPYGDPA
jgi:signal transduction histidine kinase